MAWPDRSNLTPFGCWLMDRVPVWRWGFDQQTLTGQFGMFKLGGGAYVGVACDAWTYWWPHMRYFPEWRVIIYLPFLRLVIARARLSAGGRA